MLNIQYQKHKKTLKPFKFQRLFSMVRMTGLTHLAPQAAVLRKPTQPAWTAPCLAVHRTAGLHSRAFSGSSPFFNPHR